MLAADADTPRLRAPLKHRAGSRSGRVGYDLDHTQGAEMRLEFTAVFQQVPEGHTAFGEELPGANTQARLTTGGRP